MTPLNKEQILEFFNQGTAVPVLNDGYFERTASSILKMNSFWLEEVPSRWEICPTFTIMIKLDENWIKINEEITTAGFFLNNNKTSLYKAYLLENAVNKHFLEIVQSDQTTKRSRPSLMLENGLHGKAYLFGEFGNIAWSWDQDNMRLAYIAEPIMQEQQNKSKYEEVLNWGEGCSEIVSPIICVWDVSWLGQNTPDNCLKIFNNTYEQKITPHRILFCPDDKSIVISGVENIPKLGKLMCNNRKGRLYLLHLKENVMEELLNESDDPILSGKYDCFESLSFSKTGKFLTFFSRRSSGPYNSGVALFKVEWNSASKRRSKCVIPIGVVGLYNVKIAKHCWIDDKLFFFDAQIGARKAIVAVNMDSNKYTILQSTRNKGGSFHLLDVFENNIMACYSELSYQPTLLVKTLTEEEKNAIGSRGAVELNWKPFNSNMAVGFSYRSFEISGVESFLLKPSAREDNRCLVVIPHGGPHSASLNYWPDKGTLLLVKCGYHVLFTNYHGSTGYGDEYVSSLLGNGGSIDIRDVEAASQHVMRELHLEKVFTLGISYGGFIALHLSSLGNHIGKYDACACINPVIDLATMTQLTDINDMPTITAATSTAMSIGKPLSPEDYRNLYNCSPLSKSSAMTKPVFLAFGADDLRVVPHYRNFVLNLRANGVLVKVHKYPESDHSIKDIVEETDLWVSILQFFEEVRCGISSNT